MPKNKKLLSSKCLEHHRRLFHQETRVWVQVQVEVKGSPKKKGEYRLGMVNSKLFISKVLLQIRSKFKLN